MTALKPVKLPHPVVWLILYLPFGALGGFVQVALTFMATKSGLSIGEGALLIGSQMLIQWLKWIWAPLVDITLSPKRWYVISACMSALGVFTMSAIPLGPGTLGILLAVVALANIINTIVGMSVEAMIATLTAKDEVGRISAWFQAGNLGGLGFGGALGLYLLQNLPHPWMSGAIMGGIFILCCFALVPLPEVKAHESNIPPARAIKNVFVGFWHMLRERSGALAALLCIIPINTGAAQGVLTQATVAKFWGADAGQVELVQGLLSGLITALGCFAGGWICNRVAAHKAYAYIGLVMAAVAAAMAYAPFTVNDYVVFNMAYAFALGLSYSAFTAMVLVALGQSAAATGYNVYASLSNFPLWWLGLLLGVMADRHGPRAMLLTEAGLGVAAVLFFLVVWRVANRKQPRAA